jgi:methylglutaconyl-CoA hydratase
MQAEQGSIQTDISPAGVATIAFYHPMHNSLPSVLLQSIIAAIKQFGSDDAVRVIVLKSLEHKTFCSGASFDELMSIEDEATGLAFFNGFGSVINAMRTCPKIIVGRIHGKAVGGGVGLAAATDYCMASQWASIRLSELAVGFGPFVIGPAVERKMGTAAFVQLSLTPDEWQTAAWAKQKGLFQECFETVEQLDAYIEHFCANLCRYSPEALAHLKKVFWQGTEHWDTLLPERAAISGRLSLTTHSKEAIEQFKKKA